MINKYDHTGLHKQHSKISTWNSHCGNFWKWVKWDVSMLPVLAWLVSQIQNKCSPLPFCWWISRYLNSSWMFLSTCQWVRPSLLDANYTIELNVMILKGHELWLTTNSLILHCLKEILSIYRKKDNGSSTVIPNNTTLS